nr:MAG TPA: hypothetical protein [Caudoviricetes sp.]
MNTNKSCFDSDKELMIWQDTNCLQCKKAVWYNQRLKKCHNIVVLSSVR